METLLSQGKIKMFLRYLLCNTNVYTIRWFTPNSRDFLEYSYGSHIATNLQLSKPRKLKIKSN